MTIATILLPIASYALGCISPAYFLVKKSTGKSLHQEGTGNLGATNAGRLLGKKAFVGIALLDILKGALAVLLALYFKVPTWSVAASGLAVVVGHIWPVQFRFKGGKGLATAYGVVVVLVPWISLAMWPVLFLWKAVLKRKSISMILTFACASVASIWFTEPELSGVLFVLTGLLGYTHRENLRKEAGK